MCVMNYIHIHVYMLARPKQIVLGYGYTQYNTIQVVSPSAFGVGEGASVVEWVRSFLTLNHLPLTAV